MIEIRIYRRLLIRANNRLHELLEKYPDEQTQSDADLGLEIQLIVETDRKELQG